MENVQAAVNRKKELQLPVTIGSQLVLLPENTNLVIALAGKLKEIGVDYFSIKPYSRHPLSKNHLRIDYSQYLYLEEELRKLSNEKFKVIFRADSMRKTGMKKAYGKCYGTGFISFVSANGDVWECNVFVGDKNFLIGNTNKQSMMQIWQSSRREQILSFINNGFSLENCRDLCRMDACNAYLWRLKNPLPHDNFI